MCDKVLLLQSVHVTLVKQARWHLGFRWLNTPPKTQDAKARHVRDAVFHCNASGSLLTESAVLRLYAAVHT